MNLTNDEYTRFMSYVEKNEEGCWEWQGYLDKDGYGSFYLRRKNRRAHRVGWYMRNGIPREGYVINHKCRNRGCVRPKHLECITRQENNLKGNSASAINARKMHCNRGHEFDKKYGKQRYCSICENLKSKRLQKKWKKKPLLKGV